MKYFIEGNTNYTFMHLNVPYDKIKFTEIRVMPGKLYLEFNYLEKEAIS